jgi:casein kinase 1
MRRPKKNSFTCGRTISSIKKFFLFIGLVACVVLYLDIRSRFMYQWQGEGEGGSRNGEEEEEEQGSDDDSVAPVDVYASLQESNMPLVASRFKIDELLGSGFVSRAYSGTDVHTQEEVVLKFTYINVTENTSPTPLKGIPDNVSKLKALRQEYATYQSFRGTRLLQSFFYGDYQGFKVLVTQKGGKSLIQHQELGRQWSKEDIYQIARNIILDLEQLHDKSFIHNDMHTGNIAFKEANKTFKVNLIDFNSCKKYWNTDTLQHLELKHNYFRVPIHRFSPPCYYQKKTCSRRDDLTSLGYMLVMLASEYANCSPLYTFLCQEERKGYWFGPPLPWMKVTGKQNMIDFMTNISFNILNAPNDYRQQLPDNFRKYFEHLNSLQFTSKPDYAYLLDLFPL